MNQVHFCFKPLPSGKVTYSLSFLGSQTHIPRVVSRLQGADTVGRHRERGPSGHWGFWPSRLHCSTQCFCSHGCLSCHCPGHLWSTEIFWWHFLWFLLPRCITHSSGACGLPGDTAKKQGLPLCPLPPPGSISLLLSFPSRPGELNVHVAPRFFMSINLPFDLLQAIPYVLLSVWDFGKQNPGIFSDHVSFSPCHKPLLMQWTPILIPALLEVKQKGKTQGEIRKKHRLISQNILFLWKYSNLGYLSCSYSFFFLWKWPNEYISMGSVYIHKAMSLARATWIRDGRLTQMGPDGFFPPRLRV